MAMRVHDGTRILITGANGGLGAAIAREFHARGAALVVSGRRADALAPLAAELGAKMEVADLANRSGLAQLLEVARNVDVLVLNAAVPATGDLTTFDDEEI